MLRPMKATMMTSTDWARLLDRIMILMIMLNTIGVRDIWEVLRSKLAEKADEFMIQIACKYYCRWEQVRYLAEISDRGVFWIDGMVSSSKKNGNTELTSNKNEDGKERHPELVLDGSHLLCSTFLLPDRIQGSEVKFKQQKTSTHNLGF